jgi:hypothetical protein
MTKQLIRSATAAALVIAQIAPALAQPAPPTPPTQGGPQISPPRPDLPQIQPPRPGTGGPQIQPPRPVGLQPVRPPVQPQPPTPPIGNSGNFAGVIRCESVGNRWRQCNARTGNRVELVRRLSGTCQRGRTWGFTRTYVWVERGCRADFGYGYASTSNPYPHPQPQPIRNPDRGSSNGPSTGAVIAGVVVAGGLIALLASRKKSSSPNTPASTAPETYRAGPPATLRADLSAIPSAARTSVQNCLFDAARQIGVTGGTKLSYDRTTSLEPGNGGWRFGAAVTASYPDGDRALTIYCRATPTKVIQLDFS